MINEHFWQRSEENPGRRIPAWPLLLLAIGLLGSSSPSRSAEPAPPPVPPGTAKTAPSSALPAIVADLVGDLEDISLVNLLRGLYLSQAQAEALAGFAGEAEGCRQAAAAELVRLAPRPQFERLKQELYQALPEEPPACREQVGRCYDEVNQVIGRLNDRLIALEEKVGAQLTTGQLKTFWEFGPCFVPEPDFEQPVRVGQAGGVSRMLATVELIRSTPEPVWQVHGRAYLEQILTIFENEVGEMSPEVKQDLRRRLLTNAHTIRRLPAEQYLLRRDDLSRSMMLINREKTLRAGHRQTGKLARFFLTPAAARVLPRWVATHWPQPTPQAPLDPPAPPAPPAPLGPDQGARAAPTPPATEAGTVAGSGPPATAVTTTTPTEADGFAAAAKASLSKVAEPPFVGHLLSTFPGADPWGWALPAATSFISLEERLHGIAPLLTRQGTVRSPPLSPGEN